MLDYFGKDDIFSRVRDVVSLFTDCVPDPTVPIMVADASGVDDFVRSASSQIAAFIEKDIQPR